MTQSLLDSPHLTNLTREVLAKQEEIMQAHEHEAMTDPIAIAFITFVGEKVIPVAKLYVRWMELYEAGTVHSISEHMISATLQMLDDTLYNNSLQAQSLLYPSRLN